MGRFEKAMQFTAKWEGGLSDDKADKGGLTNYGVSLVFLKDIEASSRQSKNYLRELGVSVPVTRSSVAQLTRDQAMKIFRWQFWDSLSCEDYPVPVGVVLFDMAVNHGRANAVKLIQRGCNVAGITPALVVDSKLGPRTQAAIHALDAKKLALCTIDARIKFYNAIVANNPSQKVFLKGWLNRANDLKKYVMEL